MPGHWSTYRCDRCPLILELGGYTAWSEAGKVIWEETLLACPKCGTWHRLVERDGVRELFAMPGPVRHSRIAIVRDVAGEEVEVEQWITEEDWRLLERIPDSVNPAGPFACGSCGRIGPLLSQEAFLDRDASVKGAPSRERCPVCGGPVECVGITDAV